MFACFEYFFVYQDTECLVIKQMAVTEEFPRNYFILLCGTKFKALAVPFLLVPICMITYWGEPQNLLICIYSIMIS